MIGIKYKMKDSSDILIIESKDLDMDKMVSICVDGVPILILNDISVDFIELNNLKRGFDEK